MDAITHTSHIAIRDTAKIGGDVEAATAGLIAGAMEGSREFDISDQKAASAAAEGALKGARQIHPTTVQAVRRGATKQIKRLKFSPKTIHIKVSHD